MKLDIRKALGIVLTLALIASAAVVFGGCAQPTATTAPSASPTPLPNITIRFSQFGNSLDDPTGFKNDRIKAAIEQKLNITLEYDTGTDGYDDRMALELSAGTGPDLFPTWGDATKLSKWANDGAVLKISDIVSANAARYPVLTKIFSAKEYKTYNEFYTGDKDAVFAIYEIGAFAVPPYAGVSVYNTRILNEVGYAKAPTTVDEFVDFTTKAAAKGYTGWWPRNDKLTNWQEIDKTVASPNGTSIMPPASDFNGFVMNADGTWTLMTTSDKSKEVVKLLASMYKSNALSNAVGIKGDFDDAYAMFGAGTLASANFGFGFPGQFRDFLKDPWIKANPSGTMADLTLGTALQGSAGFSQTYGAPYWMGAHYLIPASEKNPERVLDLVEFLASTEGQQLTHWGIEGTHYTKGADGQPVYNVAEWDKETKPYGYGDGRGQYVWFSYLFSATEYMVDFAANDWFTAVTHPTDNSNLWATASDKAAMDYATTTLKDTTSKVVVTLPFYYSFVKLPDSYVDVRNSLKDITNRYLAGMIGGQMDIDKEWPNYVKEYADAGAADLEQAMNAAIQEAKTKYGG